MTSVDLFGPASASGAVTVRPSETRTFGTIDSWFRDCSSPDVDDGTEFQAAWFNAVLAEMRSIARGNGMTGGAADIVAQDNSAGDVMWRALQHLYQRAQPAWSLDTSAAANQLIVTLSPAPPEIKAGMRMRVKVANDNTGPATIVVNAIAPASIKTVAGQELQKGMLVAGQIAELVHDGDHWQLVSVFSEKVVFTPRARINLATIASLANGVWGTHGTALASSSNMAPVVSANSFTLPAGTYLFLGYGSIRHNNVINATQIAQQLRLVSSVAGQIAGTFEASYLLAGQDLTTYQNLAAVANVAATDVLSVQSYIGTTSAPDFNGGQANAGMTGTLDIIRIGN